MGIGGAVVGQIVAALIAALAPVTAVAATTSASVPTTSDAVRATSGWVWPLQPQPRVVRGFDPPDVQWSAGHRGVDLAASVGQAVLSPADGVVSFSGTIAGTPVVVVAHPDGRRSTFQPVTTSFPRGFWVSRGQAVAVVSDVSGHCFPTTCVHWGVLRGKQYLDPLAFVGRAPIILLPLP